jgi:cytochrome P450 family 6
LKGGVHVGIPILGLHDDPQYYPNPEKFDPERFSKENERSSSAFTWLPFGEEPRGCLGETVVNKFLI